MHSTNKMPAFIVSPCLPRSSLQSQKSTRRSSLSTRMSFQENIAKLPNPTGNEIALLAFTHRCKRTPQKDLIVRNEPGSSASYRIFHAAATSESRIIDVDMAKEMLDMYAEIVQEAKEQPGAHKIVDFLLDVVDSDHDIRFVCKIDDQYVAS